MRTRWWRATQVRLSEDKQSLTSPKQLWTKQADSRARDLLCQLEAANQLPTPLRSLSAASPGSWLAKFSSRMRRDTAGSISSKAVRVGLPRTDCRRAESTTSFAFVALSRI